MIGGFSGGGEERSRAREEGSKYTRVLKVYREKRKELVVSCEMECDASGVCVCIKK